MKTEAEVPLGPVLAMSTPVGAEMYGEEYVPIGDGFVGVWK